MANPSLSSIGITSVLDSPLYCNTVAAILALAAENAVNTIVATELPVG